MESPIVGEVAIDPVRLFQRVERPACKDVGGVELVNEPIDVGVAARRRGEKHDPVAVTVIPPIALHPALSVATTPSPAINLLRGSAAAKHPYLRRKRLGSAAIKPFLDSPAGGSLIPLMTPKKPFEHEPVALVDHLCPEPRAVAG